MTAPWVALTTDFGRGSYVAQMKGVILSLNPRAHLIDIAHDLGPQNIRAYALCLRQCVPYFPAGTIHIVVVDPGVGTARRALCAQMHGQVFLAPDNGVLGWIALQDPNVAYVHLTAQRFWRSPVSATFHGRDIFAPVAAHLSLGVPVTALGPSLFDPVELPWPQPVQEPSRTVGEVLTVDPFGNLITNLTPIDLARWTHPHVRCQGREIGKIQRTYGDVAPGTLLALINSSDLLEIAVAGGHAAHTLSTGAGTLVEVLTRSVRSC
ncbi:SAM hydrolase/SAM-dependent halogenase family protein [Anthocerotibacter panamensis]|uniref:SAM hydrolase/SAM-dependent halogenase family protein n=1 Tax=Anthocerotibacter panamensis TaxID=2857077 RepID=UPI001C4019E8|nr:SAM-dependent chlorinase/fluorinase [Anthocerotibacter panamensis]